jgi:GNAT superfamily N-acetyltransferase
MVLLGDKGAGWLVERGRRLRPREEVDVDAAHTAGTELDVARVAPVTGLRLLAATERAEIAKLLVHRSARRRGIAQLLMERAEVESRAEGKTLLVLDTVTGDEAERLYERLGWTKLGVIPGYALYPDRRPCDTTIFWKSL